MEYHLISNGALFQKSNLHSSSTNNISFQLTRLINSYIRINEGSTRVNFFNKHGIQIASLIISLGTCYLLPARRPGNSIQQHRADGEKLLRFFFSARICG